MRTLLTKIRALLERVHVVLVCAELAAGTLAYPSVIQLVRELDVSL